MEVGLFLLIAMLVLILLGIPVAFAIGLTSLGAVVIGDYQMIIIPQRMFAGLDSFPMLAIPFFVLSGNLMTAGGINEKIMTWVSSLFGHINGSHGIITCISSGFFGAISGSGTATVASIGGLMIPTMKKKGYSSEFAGAIASSAGIVGILIPPSIFLIVYGNAVQMSITDLFAAAVIPGIGLTVLFIIYTYFKAKKLNVPVEKRSSMQEVLYETRRSIWALLMPLIILGGIFGGIFTPTEAAAVSVVYALIVGFFIYKDLNRHNIGEVFLNSCLTAATLLIVLSASNISSWVLTVARFPELLSRAILSITSVNVIILILINLVLLIAGMFMEGNVAIIILTPILLPLAQATGMSPIQFGVVMCINLCLGLLSPPVGLNLLLGNQMAEARFEKTLRLTIPYFAIGLVVLLMAIYIEPLTMALPNLIK